MRCAIDFDENKPLREQEIKAWGELQSLKEEPAYKESDIKNDKSKNFFLGVKYAFDEVRTALDNLEEYEELNEDQNKIIQAHMSGSLCEILFSILDEEYCEEG